MTPAISEEILVKDVIGWVREHRQPGSTDEEISADTGLYTIHQLHVRLGRA